MHSLSVDLAGHIVSIAGSNTDETAIVETSTAGRPIRWTYGELVEDARKLAHEITDIGVRPDDLVAVDLPACYDAVVTFLAVWMAGAAYLPLDHSAPDERKRTILSDAPVRAVLSLPAAPPSPGTATELRDGRLVAVPGDAGGGPAPAGTAYVIYTSGTTGVPKGVPVTRANLAALFDAALPWFTVGPDDVWLVAHTLAFDFSVWELWGALVTGGTAVLADRFSVRDPRRTAALVRDERITVLSQTPTAFRGLLPELMAGGTVPDLRYVVFGGERLRPAVLAGLAGVSDAVVYNMYGITEVTVHATIRRVTADDIRHDRPHIGEVLPGFVMAVVDADGREVADGETGELLLHGPQVVPGYLGRPELTAGRFPRRDGARFYRSGDTVRRVTEDGRPGLHYVGRLDDQVQVRGYRVEMGEVEHAVSRMDGVTEACVVALEDADGTSLACGYSTGSGAAIPRRRWVEHLTATLPRYMIPDVFHHTSDTPRTPNGKIDRKEMTWRIQNSPAAR